jgi:hypothetical protein
LDRSNRGCFELLFQIALASYDRSLSSTRFV